MTIRPVEADLFHTDGQTDTTKPIVAFHNFANAPEITLWLPFSVLLLSWIL